MVKANVCQLEQNAKKSWDYDQYYYGEKDEHERKNGEGENHWTCAESIEWYNGNFTRDTMHGYGNYHWRYFGRDHEAATYEGFFYTNRFHGYSTMSYSDGMVFQGLYYNNVRWGPGVEHFPYKYQNVGIWKGSQLIKLGWQPNVPSVALDFNTHNNGHPSMQRVRRTFTKNMRRIGEVNSAIDLLKYCGLDQGEADKLWPRIYPKHCTDKNSPVYEHTVFDKDYYGTFVEYLCEYVEPDSPRSAGSKGSKSDSGSAHADAHYAWNNNADMIHMMNHSYKHDYQRKLTNFNLQRVLNGPRSSFSPPAKHERDCRTLLMASYLGNIEEVTQLINEADVNPNVADIQGNTALIYAVCGIQPVIGHFLIEAGANVNEFNDMCCTALGVAMMIYMCALNEIPPNSMIQALLPSDWTHNVKPYITDWEIERDLMRQQTDAEPKISQLSKASKTSAIKRLKSTMTTIQQKDKFETFDDNLFEEEKKHYDSIQNEFNKRVNIYFTGENEKVPYIFEVKDMVDDILKYMEDICHVTSDISKAKAITPQARSSRLLKSMLISNETIWQNHDRDLDSENSYDKLKADMLAQMMLHIIQLLDCGADPKLVIFPQPALVMAIASGCCDLVEYICRHGADVNEVYPDIHGYTPLHIAVTRPFSFENLEIIKSLLENGADATQELPCRSGIGPTLLHALLAMKTSNEVDEEVLRQTLVTFMNHDCNPFTMYNGKSAIEAAMLKNLSLVNTFIKHPKVNLKKRINELNHTILTKMFFMPYFKTISGYDLIPIITNLILYGADPLGECHDGEDKYKNIFVFIKNCLEKTNYEATGRTETKVDPKAKMDKKPTLKKKSLNTVSQVKVDVTTEYNLMADFLKDCVRLMYIKWIQGKIVKQEMKHMYKYLHRDWSVFLKDMHDKTKKAIGLWLSPQRCLEIFDVLKSKKIKCYNDMRTLKKLLCIVHYCNLRAKTYNRFSKLTAQEKNNIDRIIRAAHIEHRRLSTDEHTFANKKPYAHPELTIKDDEKYKVCFECLMPLDDKKLPCIACNLVNFCSLKCLKVNIDRPNCHPCNEELNEIYSPVKLVEEEINSNF